MLVAKFLRTEPAAICRRLAKAQFMQRRPGRGAMRLTACIAMAMLAGCYTPMHSPAIPAPEMSDYYRMPDRSVAPLLNLAKLTVPPPADYILGPNDTLEVTVPDLYQGSEIRPIIARLMADGTVTLPLVGKVEIGGMNLSAAQEAVNAAYADGFLANPRASLSLSLKHTIDVAVIGLVTNPGVHQLPRYENDIGHALALAGGLQEFAAERVEVHRRISTKEFEARIAPSLRSEPVPDAPPAPAEGAAANTLKSTVTLTDFLSNGNDPAQHLAPFVYSQVPDDDEMEIVLNIPLRGGQVTVQWENGMAVHAELLAEDVTLNSGDVVVIPRKPDEVFFVVGPLNRTNVVNFTVRERDRELGNAFLIPPDRDIDVVTAVAMAGYIDPIESPDKVILHRTIPGCAPMLVKIDIMKARYDWQENMYVQPGDILYLNPDPAWYFRRTFDRIVPQVLLSPYTEAMRFWIPGGNGVN